MARPLRLEHAGAVWHVHNRGNNGGDIFFADRDHETCFELLEESVRRFHWVIHQYMMMTEPMPAWLRSEWTLARFGLDREQRQREYRQFVDAGANIERGSYEKAVGQLFLGSAEWIAGMRRLIEEIGHLARAIEETGLA
jgi:hypothetical protein